MWLSLLVVVLLLAIAYFHTIQGLFSALLSAVLAILCSALAFATFEYIAANALAPLKPNCALGLALVGMFGLPLLILRLLLDKLVHRTCLLPVILDRAGGFVFGVVAAFVMVGMLTIGLQLMPFGNGFLGFSRVNREDPTKPQNELWLKPDRVAVRLASMMSGGVLSGEEAFSDRHPDFVTEIGWIEGVLPDGERFRRGVRRYAPPGSIQVLNAWETDYVYRKTLGDRGNLSEYQPKSAEPGSKFIRVRMQVEREAQDADNQHRFTLFQVRLVGNRGDDRPEQYHAMAVVDSEQPEKAICDLIGGADSSLLGLLLKPHTGSLVDVVFDVPESFKPRFVEYKSGARGTVVMGSAPPAEGTVIAGTDATGEPLAPGRDRVSGVALAGSFFGDGFPGGVTMTFYRKLDPEINPATQAFKSGHIHGWLPDQGTRQRDVPVSRFDVPTDKRLLHLSVENLQPGSTLGRALNLAVTTMKNYIVTDSVGRQYRPVGSYVIARIGVNDYVEIQYAPEYAEITGRGVRPWAKMRDNFLHGDYTYAFLYLIEPGAKLARFNTGGSGFGTHDLAQLNLAAPE